MCVCVREILDLFTCGANGPDNKYTVMTMRIAKTSYFTRFRSHTYVAAKVISIGEMRLRYV